MRLVKFEKRPSKESGIRIDDTKTVQEILRILNDIKSSFTIAKYFLALNQRPEMIASFVSEGCENFEMAKKLLASSNGLKEDRNFLWKFEEIERDISCLKRIVKTP